MGTAGPGTVTSGGDGGTGGDRRRRLALGLLAVYLAVFLVQGWANGSSMAADLADAGVAVPRRHVWIWEWSSIALWLALSPVLWRLVAAVRPPRFGWPATLALHLLATVVVSHLHVAGAVTLREAAYALEGADYDFGPWWPRWLYEYRKDLATYVLLAVFMAVGQHLLARAGEAEPLSAEPGEPVLRVPDGPVTRHIPAGEIEHVAAAGNYVELDWRGRALLHRATLAAVEAELGDRFVRIHRGRLVRRDAVRAVAVNQAGDFEVELASGARLKGSRRYRAGVQPLN